MSQADGCTTGMSRHLPSEPSLQGLALQASGLRELWKAFWLASLLWELPLVEQNSLTSPHLTAPHSSEANRLVSLRYRDTKHLEISSNMFSTLVRRAAQGTKPRSSAEYIRKIRELYPPKKVWPPDFKRLSPQEQLKFEKKFKRRLAIRAERPRWIKFIKLVQLFTVTSMLS